MALKDTTDHTADQQARCEFDKPFFSEGECQWPGEVRFDGSLLCVPHTELLRLEAREGTLLVRVFEMDKWLDGPGTRANQSRWWRVLRQRDETVERLRLNRTLIEAHKEVVH
jgi:hypothetical protein